MAFQSRDLTGKAVAKYNTDGQSGLKGFLYNYDRCVGREQVFLVEGPLDVWRMGDGSCATFGTQVTDEQKRKIRELRVKEIVVCWDSDAYIMSLEFGKELASRVPRVKAVRLPGGHDPDTLGIQEIYARAEATPCL